MAARAGLKAAVALVKFVHEQRAVMGRDRTALYHSSDVLRSVQDCVHSKMNPRSNLLT